MDVPVARIKRNALIISVTCHRHVPTFHVNIA